MNALRCPVCKHDLIAEAKRYVCANNHAFDIARQGYVNLLLSSQMPSKMPGDSALMLADRHALLEAGFYAPLRDCIVDKLAQFQSSTVREQTVLDLGCGEGYYTAAFAAPNRRVYGLDIAKAALAIAAKRERAVTWCVGTSRALPFHDDRLNVVINIFCRPHSPETQRVLREDGMLLIVGPGAGHLHELRALLYENVDENDGAENGGAELEGFTLTQREELTFEFTLRGEQIMQLARMTPHYWRAPAARRAQLENIEELTLQAEFVIRCFTKNPPLAELATPFN